MHILYQQRRIFQKKNKLETHFITLPLAPGTRSEMMPEDSLGNDAFFPVIFLNVMLLSWVMKATVFHLDS